MIFTRYLILINNCCEESGVRSQPTPRPSPSQEGKKRGIHRKYWRWGIDNFSISLVLSVLSVLKFYYN
ncbi:hypothetical protein [Okeania sp. SIO2B9]|uniref:hypothetical protein n=1 Tax=Okeania sp. SIO2B9 TaxID=2607782 RepID=UPI00257ED44F|nr:hypothetical protein [Okeania sp. SIO2B9]